MAPRNRKSPLTLGEVRAANLESWIGRVIIAAAIISAAVSFWQVQWAARLIGIPEIAAWGFPVIVDGIGTVLAGLTMVMHNQPFRRRAYVWCFFLVFIAISLACNALHAVVHVAENPMNLPPFLDGARWFIVVLLASIPPVGAAIGMHAYAFTRRHGIASKLRATVEEERAVRGGQGARTPDPRTPAPAHAPAHSSVSPVHGPAHGGPVHAPPPPPHGGDRARELPLTLSESGTAHIPRPAPAPDTVHGGVHGGPPAPVNGVVHAGQATAPVEPPPGRPDDVPADKWARHWLEIPEFLDGWRAYAALREEGDDDPKPTPVKKRAGIGGDRSRVSRWMPLYEARWDAEHADAPRTPDEPVHAPAHADVHAPAHDPVHAPEGRATPDATPDATADATPPDDGDAPRTLEVEGETVREAVRDEPVAASAP